MYFRPWNRTDEMRYYLDCRREGWLSSHGTMAGFDEFAFRDAVSCHEVVFVVMDGTERAGILELDVEKGQDEGIGAIPFVYLDPKHRRQGRGELLLLMAADIYRAMGRTKLRLRCAPENETACRFYMRHGFYKIGMAEDSVVPLYLMERPI